MKISLPEEAGQEAADNQGLQLQCHCDLHGRPLCLSRVQLALSCFTFRDSCRTVFGQADTRRRVVQQRTRQVLVLWIQRIGSGFVCVNMRRLAAPAVCRLKVNVDGQSQSSLCDNRQCRSTYFRPTILSAPRLSIYMHFPCTHS